MKPIPPVNLLFEKHLGELGVRNVVVEERFCERQFRLDYYWPGQRIAFELNGGQWKRGHRSAFWGRKEAARRHLAGNKETPAEEEYTKLNLAQLTGIRVLQFTNEQVLDGRVKTFLGDWLSKD